MIDVKQTPSSYFYLHALFAGALLPFAFAPYELPFLAVVSLCLLLQLVQHAKPRSSALIGYYFGLGYFGHGIYWVYFSIHHFGNAPLWLAVIIMLGMVAILAGYIAALCWLVNKFFRQTLWARYLLVFPALWVSFEWFRSILFTGFPWLSLGFSQLNTWLSGWAPVVGVFGVSWGVALTASALFYLFQSRLIKASQLLAIMLLCAVWGGGLGLSQIGWSEKAGESIKVALLQGNIPQEIKWMPSFLPRNINIYEDMTLQQTEADLIIWPETAIPAFYHRIESNVLRRLKLRAETQQQDVVMGLPVLDDARRFYFNGLLSVRQPKEIYFKRHLVPLGEYMPLKPLSTIILKFLNIPLSDFNAGADEQPLLQAAGYPFASSICYEDVFQITSLDGLPEAAYLVNVSNDTWFGDTIAPFQHLEMARMRALESGRYLLRSTNTGLTAIVGPKGELLKQAPMFKRFALTGSLTPMKGATPFVAGGWWLVLALNFVVLLTSLRCLDSARR
ncbi:MAG: apolipoprotein N-acyltransferase [Cycloclasticus sp. symbiont of Poecilosclerida sp. M]|nr:MAG: apolipoprotein N-acyltransferase [Cycloclasticus sp. symbiont of Poecilosclerida sp. M]